MILIPSYAEQFVRYALQIREQHEAEFTVDSLEQNEMLLERAEVCITKRNLSS
jgi:hypothetical protein